MTAGVRRYRPRIDRTARVGALLIAPLVFAGCGTYRLEPLSPDDRGPQARVPGLPPAGDSDTPPQSGNSAQPGTPGTITVLLEPVDCAVCAQMLEGRLRTVPGVGVVAIDRRAGRVLIAPRVGAAVSAPAVRAQAEAANFVVRSVQAQP